MVIVDPHNPRAAFLYKKLKPYIDDIPLTSIIGGDGWMLNCIRNNTDKQPFLGLNAGTLGFLMNDVQNEKACLNPL